MNDSISPFDDFTPTYTDNANEIVETINPSYLVSNIKRFPFKFLYVITNPSNSIKVKNHIIALVRFI